MAGPADSPKRYVNLLSLNVCGLRKKLNDGIFEEYIKNFDIICLTETKTDTITETLLPNNFKYVYKEKSKSNGSKFPLGGIHGIGVLVRDKIFEFVSVLKNGISETVLWLEISKKAFGFSFILGAVYIPRKF